MSAFLFSPEGNLHVIQASEQWQKEDLLTIVSESNQVICPESVYISFNGRLLQQCGTFSVATHDIIRVEYRLAGGKGGFGSMLRAIGAQIEKTTSREACRDLSGRRMRDVNDEKKITEWVAKQADRERDLAKQKQERLEKRRAEPKHNFDDTTYAKQIQENSEKIDDALKQGFKASASGLFSGIKRTSKINKEAPKKRKMWTDLDGEELDDSDNETISTATLSASTSASDVSVEGSKKDQGFTSHPSNSTSASTINTATETSLTSTADALLKGGKRGQGLTCHPASRTSINTNCTSYESNTYDYELTSKQPTYTDIVINTGEEPCIKEEKSLDNCKTDKEYMINKLPTQLKPLNINKYNSPEELELLGLELLKEHLKALGLKCGGTIQERAQRLFATKGKTLEDLDPALFAKPTKGKNKRK